MGRAMDHTGQQAGRISSFVNYLRTGRRTVRHGAIEYKFNPYHDPRNGQFTFAPGKGGFRGGGGSFGGGGATGDWEAPRIEPKKTVKAKPFMPKGGSGGGGGATGSYASPVAKPKVVTPKNVPDVLRPRSGATNTTTKPQFRQCTEFPKMVIRMRLTTKGERSVQAEPFD